MLATREAQWRILRVPHRKSDWMQKVLIKLVKIMAQLQPLIRSKKERPGSNSSGLFSHKSNKNFTSTMSNMPLNDYNNFNSKEREI